LSSNNTKQIRRFGFFAFLFFGCLFTFAIWTEKLYPTYLFGFLSIIGLCFILIPSKLKPLYAAWLKIAQFLHKIVSMLILAGIFYLVITPAALIKRALGGAPLKVKWDKTAFSYWMPRTESAQPKERFLTRY
jgi:hypothetical protein